MSNDPDLIDKPCLACEGDGGWASPINAHENVADDDVQWVYVDCATCGGNGVVIEP